MGSMMCCCKNQDSHRSIVSLKLTEAEIKEKEKKASLKLSFEAISKIMRQVATIKKVFTLNDFLIQGKVGNSLKGYVYIAELKQNIKKGISQKYVIKKVNNSLITKRNSEANVRIQKELLATYQNLFVIQLLYTFNDQKHLYFVEEECSGGNTFSLLGTSTQKGLTFKNLGQQGIKFIAGCVILGLQYFHKFDILYRQLSHDNVYLSTNGYAKLQDFRLCLDEMSTKRSKYASCGLLYKSPEIILQNGYNLTADMWSLGIYLYELTMGETPFSYQQITKGFMRKKTKQQSKQQCQNHLNWTGSTNISQQLKDLINRLLRFDAKSRLGSKQGIKQVKDHIFFKQFDWDSLEKGKFKSPLQEIVRKFPIEIIALGEYENPEIDDKLSRVSHDTQSQFEEQNRKSHSI